MIRFITPLATLALLLGALVTPASANHMSIYVYSPYTDSNWWFSQGDHPGRLQSARDVTWPSVPSSITFNATAGVTAEVATVALNCNTSQTWDKYVTLSLYNGTDL